MNTKGDILERTRRRRECSYHFSNLRMGIPRVSSAARGPKMEIPIKFGFPEKGQGMVRNFEQTGKRLKS